MEAAPTGSVHAGRRHAEQKQGRTAATRGVWPLCGPCDGTVRKMGSSTCGAPVRSNLRSKIIAREALLATLCHFEARSWPVLVRWGLQG
jgi:hypothetical protein